MEEGKTYLISKGQIKPANKKFCDFHDYEITLGRETTCSPVTGGDALAIKYDFVQIAKLEDVEANKTVGAAMPPPARAPLAPAAWCCVARGTARAVAPRSLSPRSQSTSL